MGLAGEPYLIWSDAARRDLAADLAEAGFDLDDLWVRHLYLPVRVTNALMLHGAMTLRQLLEQRYLWSGGMKNVGIQSILETQDMLEMLVSRGPRFRIPSGAASELRARELAAGMRALVPEPDSTVMRRYCIDGASFQEVGAEMGENGRRALSRFGRIMLRLRTGFAEEARRLLEERLDVALDEPFLFHETSLGSWFSGVPAGDVRLLLHVGTPLAVDVWEGRFLTNDKRRCREAIRGLARALRRDGPKSLEDAVKEIRETHGLFVDAAAVRAAPAATGDIDAHGQMLVARGDSPRQAGGGLEPSRPTPPAPPARRRSPFDRKRPRRSRALDPADLRGYVSRLFGTGSFQASVVCGPETIKTCRHAHRTHDAAKACAGKMLRALKRRVQALAAHPPEKGR